MPNFSAQKGNTDRQITTVFSQARHLLLHSSPQRSESLQTERRSLTQRSASSQIPIVCSNTTGNLQHLRKGHWCFPLLLFLEIALLPWTKYPEEKVSWIQIFFLESLSPRLHMFDRLTKSEARCYNYKYLPVPSRIRTI